MLSGGLVITFFWVAWVTELSPHATFLGFHLVKLETVFCPAESFGVFCQIDRAPALAVDGSFTYLGSTAIFNRNRFRKKVWLTSLFCKQGHSSGKGEQPQLTLITSHGRKGSTLVMRAINANCGKMLRKAGVREVARGRHPGRFLFPLVHFARMLELQLLPTKGFCVLNH